MNDQEFTTAYRTFQKDLRSLIQDAKLPAIVKLSLLREAEISLARYVQALTTGEEGKKNGQD